MAKLDIYSIDKKLAAEIKRLEKSSISEHNKRVILDFVRDMQITEKPKEQTLVKYYGAMRVIAETYLNSKQMDGLTEAELKDLKFKIDTDSSRGIWTKHKYGICIKKLYKYLDKGQLVKFWKTTVKKRDRPQVQASDILSEHEVSELINIAGSIRDKALIAMLYELGARISEVGNLRIKALKHTEHGYLVDINGKTGHRTPLLIHSKQYLGQWLQQHPGRDDPEAPLWITMYGRAGRRYKHMRYTALRNVIIRAVKRAGIKKRVHPHLFRHTRVTHVLSSGIMNESQAKIFFGWTPDSGMLATYSHLRSDDANKALLAALGLIEVTNGKPQREVFKETRTAVQEHSSIGELKQEIADLKSVIFEWIGRYPAVRNELEALNKK